MKPKRKTGKQPPRRMTSRLPHELHDAIARLARSARRSFNSEVVYRLEKSVENNAARTVEE